MTTLPSSSSAWTFLGVMFVILALVWTPSVTMPACAPVREMAGTSEGVQRDGGQGDGGLFAGGQEHVHFALVGQRRQFLGHFDEVVGHPAHGGDDHHDLAALGAVRRHPRGDISDALRIGDRRSPEFLNNQHSSNQELEIKNQKPGITNQKGAFVRPNWGRMHGGLQLPTLGLNKGGGLPYSFQAMKPLRSRLGFALSVFAGMALHVSVWAATNVDIRASGATGDGQTPDTAAIKKAIDACAEAGGGRVVFPPGHYLSGTIRLRSGVTLQIDAGARLIGTTNLALYSQPYPPDYMPEAKWGKWHRGLIVGENVENIGITGAGVIDGNKVFDPTGEEKMRGPHGIILVNCQHFTLRDVTIVDAANYAVYAEISDDLEVRNVKIVGGWDGVHWRGAPERWCHNVTITGCQFYTGDDAIAGRYWDNTVIKDCLINSSCNGIRLLGPATRLTIANNLFRGPGERAHRSSGALHRTNMLAGIILQPGAWDRTRGPLDDIFIADNVMQNVASPVTLWTRGNNPVGRVVIDGLWATGVYRSAMSFESWADAPIGHVEVRNVRVGYDGGGKRPADGGLVKYPVVDARELPVWGVYARNVKDLTLDDVRLNLATNDLRPAVVADRVVRLELDDFKFTRVPGVAEPIVTNAVGNLLIDP